MPARTPGLGGGSTSNPFGANNFAFGAFSLGAGSDPTMQALSDASNARQDIGTSYGNGTASLVQYQAAIAAERAAASQLLGSSDPNVVKQGQSHIEQLDNLSRDTKFQYDETQARSQGDSALLTFYQSQIGTMQSGSALYTDIQKRITDLQTNIANQTSADNTRAAAYELATATAAYNQGSLSADDYKAAYAKYAGTLKAGTAESVNAKDNLVDLGYRIDRNKIVSSIDSGGGKQLSDLLAFDKDHLSGMQPGSKGYSDAFSAYEATQTAKYNEDESAVVKKYNGGQLTATGAQQFYIGQLASYGDNPQLMQTIQGRADEFAGRVQAEKDKAADDGFSNGTMSTPDYLAYAKSRQAAFAPGTQEYDRWNKAYSAGRDHASEATLIARSTASSEYDTLQKFIADHSTGPKGATSTATTQRYLGNGQWTTVTTTSSKPPTAAQAAAWQKVQVAVADAKAQLSAKGAELQGLGGYVSDAQMVTFYQGLQGGVVKGTPQWLSYQGRIDSFTAKQHADAVLNAQGVKVGYGGLDGTATSTPGAGPAAHVTGGGGGSRGAPATSVAGNVTIGHTGASTGMAGMASQFLQHVGAPDSQGNRQAVMAMMIEEGGGPNNPLNLHGAGTGGTRYVNASDPNVAVYNTSSQAVAANARNMLQNAYGYPAAIAALRSNNPKAFLDAIANSGWAASQYGLSHNVGTEQHPRWVRDPNGHNELLSVYANHFGALPGTDGGQTAPPTSGALPGNAPGSAAMRSAAPTTTKGGVQAPAPSTLKLPPNLDGTQFEKLYAGITKAYTSGEQRFTYTDAQGNSSVINIPATAAARLALITQLDDSNLHLRQEQARADPKGQVVDFATGQVTTKSQAIDVAVARAGNNLLTLLSTETKGATEDVTKRVPLGTMTAAGRADALHPQVNETSLTPLAAADRLTSITVAAIKAKTVMMEAELDAGHFDNAYAIYGQIHNLASPTTGAGAQINAYLQTASADIATIEKSHPGSSLSSTGTSDLNELQNGFASKVGAASKVAADRMGTDFFPFVKADAAGNVIPGSRGEIQMQDHVVLDITRGSNGTTSVKPRVLSPAAGGYSGGKANYSDGKTITGHIDDGRGGLRDVQVPWHTGVIGSFVDSNGKVLGDMIGKIDDVTGAVMDPLGTGRWIPGDSHGVNLVVPAGFTATPVTNPPGDPNGQVLTLPNGTPLMSYSWPAPAGMQDTNGKALPDGSRLTLSPDQTNGFYNYVTPVLDSGNKPVNQIVGRMGQAPIAGLKVDTSSMTQEQFRIYTMPGLSGPFIGMDAYAIQQATQDPRSIEQHKAAYILGQAWTQRALPAGANGTAYKNVADNPYLPRGSADLRELGPSVSPWLASTAPPGQFRDFAGNPTNDPAYGGYATGKPMTPLAAGVYTPSFVNSPSVGPQDPKGGSADLRPMPAPTQAPVVAPVVPPAQLLGPRHGNSVPTTIAPASVGVGAGVGAIAAPPVVKPSIVTPRSAAGETPVVKPAVVASSPKGNVQATGSLSAPKAAPAPAPKQPAPATERPIVVPKPVTPPPTSRPGGASNRPF